jgi:hypothetical protein
MSDEIRRTPDDEVDGAEGWERLTDEPEIRGVIAYRPGADDDWRWKIELTMAEFLREEPLEGEMRRGMDAALRSVPGVANVGEEDREVWGIDGDPSGEDLVRAAAQVVDGLADRARAVYMDDGN